MRFIVRLQKASVSFAEVEIDAESADAAKEKVEATTNLNKLEWMGEEILHEVIGIEKSFSESKEPRCSACGSQQFRELQTVYESQRVSWNAEIQQLEYGHADFNEVESVDGIECASCGKDLGEDFFQPWHQGKTRSEIYGEHETTNNTKGEDQHD